ncbi:MAG TPA: site-specific integrase [Chloroflexi bacterium]|jgi:integrase|nr:site-specific integrase [Chloroflexota bacterium]
MSKLSRRSPGEGSIIQRQDGRWQASLQVDGHRRTVYGATRQECAAKLADLQRQVTRAGILPDPGKRTVNDLLDAWLEVKAPIVRPRTLADYQDVCDRYLRPPLGKTRLNRLTPDRIQRLYARYQMRAQSRAALKAHRVLSQALALAVRWGWIGNNPCDRVDAPLHRYRRHEPWDAGQLRTFLDGTRDHWLGPLWMFLATTGCRLGEALALEWGDVDLAAGTVTINKAGQHVGGRWTVTEPKTRSGIRTITLPREAIGALRRQAEYRLAHGGGVLVFANQSGAPLNRTTVAHAMRVMCKRLAVPALSPHGLRHLHASILLAEGLPLPEVSRRLGHANAGITASIYSHAVRDDSAAVAAIGRALGERG